MESPSPNPTTQIEVQRGSPDSADGDYAFLVHSANTLPDHLPPAVNDKPLARQKRRRTSPEDQATLDAAYKQNPKPDRAARLALVHRVALGEKEVQIWFQNRRQSARRKTRPLLPHEIAQYSNFSTPYDPAVMTPGFEESHEREDLTRGDCHKSNPTNSSSAKEEGDDTHDDFSAVGTLPPPASRIRRASDDCYTALSPITLPLSSQDRPSSLGYLANRRSAPSLRPSQEDPIITPGSALTEQAPRDERRLKKSASSIRLSMTSEGNAKVVTNSSSPTPSPPRSQFDSLPSLSASDLLTQSTATVSTQQTDSSKASQSLRRSLSGRSRDSRAWEFWCDKDSRSELEEKAKQETSGSAADAIGVLRSASGRSILGAIPSKRISLFSRHTQVKRSKIEATSKTALQRSTSSFGRLQGKFYVRDKTARKTVPGLKHAGSAVEVYIPGNDSDKENWTPELDIYAGPDRQSDAGAPEMAYARRALGERKQSNGLTRAVGGGRIQRKTAGVDVENIDPDADDEISAFMGRTRKSASVSEEDDLDCVQGLLSLSQGNWR